MAYIQHEQVEEIRRERFYSHRWFKIVIIPAGLILLVGAIFAWKTGGILNKISSGGIMRSLIHTLPGVKDELKGETDGRVNILVLGMRGENLPGGGLLADTIMVASIKPAENKVAMISIPRDLYVKVPETEDHQKINAVHAYGEQDGKKQGLEDMKTIVGEVVGIPIHYVASINFAGFKQLIDAVGGVDIALDAPFSEPLQFQEARVCDPNVFTEPTGEYEYKKDKKGKVVKQYPLCNNPNNNECGGEFNLPAGKQTLDGDKALCFVRSRKTSSDFERAKRQQLVIKLLKEKLFSAGTLTDFGKINKISDSLGDNVRTDMQAWEMSRMFELYQQMKDVKISQRVLENSEEGLLYHPENSNGAGYILLPLGDNYDRIHQMAEQIFDLPEQSDIKPK